MPRGGQRQGTPGRGYGNRTDLQAAPNMDMNTAASGGMTASAPPAPEQPPQGLPGPMIGADEVPNLSTPTLRPGEPLMTGVPIGLGAGRSALGPMPPTPVDPVRQVLEALSLSTPNPDLERALAQMDFEGR